MRCAIDHGAIEIVQGDITQEHTEAIVNAANNHFWMGGGVAGAIKRRGGAEIESEAVSQGPVDVGQAVLTSGGSLAAKYVIHAAVMGQDLHTDADKIKAATKSSMALAEKKSISSLSFPALGTGVGGFSPNHCASIMIAETIDFLQRSKHLKEVRFVLFDAPTFTAFEEELKLRFSSKRTG